MSKITVVRLASGMPGQWILFNKKKECSYVF